MTTHHLFFYCTQDGILVDEQAQSMDCGDIVVFYTDSSTSSNKSNQSGVEIHILDPGVFGADLSKFTITEGNPIARRVLQGLSNNSYAYLFQSQKCKDNQQAQFIING